MNDKKNNSIRYFSVSTFLLTGKQMMLAMMLACSPLAMSAQKISVAASPVMAASIRERW